MINVNKIKDMIKALEGTVDELEMYETYKQAEETSETKQQMNDSLEQIHKNLERVETGMQDIRRTWYCNEYKEKTKCI